MKKKFNVTIGIPAFNEEKNIGFLIDQLLSQNFDLYKLQEIIVSSDNSTDRTVDVVKGFNLPFVQVLDNKKRIGVSGRQNQIINLTTSDVLVLLNADIFIRDNNFIKKLIGPIVRGEADLTSPEVHPFKPRKVIETTLAAGFLIKGFIYRSIHKRDNIYLCHGAARAFSKRFYERLKFKESVGEDAYAYLLCKFNKFNFKFTKTKCFIKLPETISDHEKQSIRFLQSQTKFYKEFGQEFVRRQYGSSNMFFGIIPTLVLRSIFHGLSKNPIYTTLYILLSIWIKIKGFFYKKVASTWEISESSKNLHID